MSKWRTELAIEIMQRHEDTIRSRYIDIRRNRLGSMFPAELLLDVGLLEEMHHLIFLIGEADYEIIKSTVLGYVENIMDEVEGII